MINTAAVVLPKRLDSIQALRGIAALMVLFFHMATFQRQMAGSQSSDIALISGIWDNGWAGVDLFFVISGFIMVYVTRQTGRGFDDVKTFLVSRITRIYPLWWVCAGIMTSYFLVTYGIPAAPDRVEGASEAVSYAVKSFFLIPQDAAPILGLGWTLIHEMFFYLVFAAILFLPRRYLPLALFGWAIITLIASQFIPPTSFARNPAELLASPLSLEFIAGGFMGYIVLKGKIFLPKLIFLGGVILVCLGLLFFPDAGEAFYTVSRVAIFTLPFLMMIYGWVGCELRGALGVPNWLVRLGDWSYSLYLTHYIVLVTLRRMYRMVVPEDLWVGASGVWDNLIFAVLAMMISIITASIFYNMVEKPSLKFFKRLRFKTH